jgi:hypothetical protein
MSTPHKDDLVLIERAGTVYKCRHEEVVDNHMPNNGLYIVFSRLWTYTGTGGSFLGSPTGRRQWKRDDYYLPAITDTMTTGDTSCSWSLRPCCQFYTDNLYGNGTSGWSASILPDAYYNDATDNTNFTNGLKKGVMNGWHFSAHELMGACRATHGTFSKWRWYQYAGASNAMYGGTFAMGWKLIPDIRGTNQNTYQYSGSGGGTFTSFGTNSSGSNTSVLTSMSTSGWKEVTGSSYNINWS